ncbi:MAG: TolC family protein [Bacteroidales bacterium]|nr:TolC family protein [Bacteroidales bacterium]
MKTLDLSVSKNSPFGMSWQLAKCSWQRSDCNCNGNVNGKLENIANVVDKYVLVRKFLLLITFTFLMCVNAFAQNSVECVLAEVEKNNTGLAALQMQLDAQSISNKTGIYLQNPEFEYAWFAGNPDGIGNKTNISLRQQFDFPTAYLHKTRIANARNDQLLLEFENQRRELLFEARLICLELINANIRAQEIGKRLQHAERMANAYETMFDAGETNIIELNKAKLNFLGLQNQAERIEITRQSLQNKLAGLNGGIQIQLADTSFYPISLSEDFEQWYVQAEERNPVLKWLSQEIEINRKQEKLQKALSLPGFNTGYVSEILTLEKFRGFAIGISIPLWENKNTVRYTKAHTSALQGSEHDKKLQFYNQLKAQHAQALSLNASLQEYERLLQSIDNTKLLARAWEQGELSLTNYLLELSYYYQSVDNLLEMELELYQTLAGLNKYLD